jgi:hypothetical protein
MSAANRSGSGDETTSANVVRNPPASVSGSCIVRSSGTMAHIATGSPVGTPPLPGSLCVDNATEAVLFRAEGKILADKIRHASFRAAKVRVIPDLVAGVLDAKKMRKLRGPL